MTTFDWTMIALFYFGACNVIVSYLFRRDRDPRDTYIVWRAVVAWLFLLLCTPYILYLEHEEQ